MLSNDYPLSKRQRQVLDLLLQGKSNKQIALELGISESTIEFHLRNIYEKLQVRSRTEAILKLGQFSGVTGGELRESVVDPAAENKHNGGSFLEELKMKNRPFSYFLAGSLFGAIYWFYISGMAAFWNGMTLPENNSLQEWIVLSLLFVSYFGVWLFPAILPAVFEYRRSRSVRSSVTAVVIVWVSAAFGYHLIYTILLALVGLPQMEHLLLINMQSPDFWQHWNAIFRTLILSHLLKWVVINLLVGIVTGLISTLLYSYWVRKTSTVLAAQP